MNDIRQPPVLYLAPRVSCLSGGGVTDVAKHSNRYLARNPAAADPPHTGHLLIPGRPRIYDEPRDARRAANARATKSMKIIAAALLGAVIATAALAQAPLPTVAANAVVLPANTVIQVTPVEEISSINMKVGDVHMLQVASDVAQNGTVIIPRGAPVKATVSYRTGKGIGGKSAKFELAFDSVTVNGSSYALKGKHRQEGRGNTVGALLGSMIITGKSAVISSGQAMNAFTAVAIPGR